MKRSDFQKIVAYILAVGGIIGFLAAFILTVEKIELIKNPAFQPSCDINPVISCGSVMETSQAEAFGLPNSILGIGSFAIVITIGVAMLAGAAFKRWFWLGLQAGAIFGVVFIHWLIWQSLYNIGALCPYCMVVWVVTIPIFWYVTLFNLVSGNISTPRSLKPVTSFLQRHHLDILGIWFLTIIAFILNRFWYYFSTLFS